MRIGGQVLFSSTDEQSLLATAKRNLNFYKAIIAGDGRAGKTSLLRQLRGKAFNENEQSTCGVELRTVEVGGDKWAKTDLASVGDVAVLLAEEFKRREPVSATAPAPAGLAPAPVAASASPVAALPAASPAADPAAATPPVQYKKYEPIAYTSDLPPFMYVIEGSDLSLSVGVTGGTPDRPLHYRWRHNGVVMDGETSSIVCIPSADSRAAGDYFVEVFCESQPTPVNSSVTEVRIVPSIMARVNSILRQQGNVSRATSPELSSPTSLVSGRTTPCSACF